MTNGNDLIQSSHLGLILPQFMCCTSLQLFKSVLLTILHIRCDHETAKSMATDLMDSSELYMDLAGQ